MESEQFNPENTVILSPDDLKIGMYVSYLDRPWTETDFPFRGFRVDSDEELRRLRESCEYVFVDPQRGDQKTGYQQFFEDKARSAEKERAAEEEQPRDYEDQHPTEREFRAAKAAHASFRSEVVRAFEQARVGALQDLAGLKAAAEDLVDSVVRMPDALIYLVRTQASGDYLYRHAVACAVMCAAMGRQMGLPRGSLLTLAMGGALLDIGKTRTPSDLLQRTSALTLSSGELHQLRRHVEYSLEIISKADPDNSQLSELVAAHHERHNGSGYPRGLAANSIPVLARIAAIVDMYDAMISERSYGRRATPYEAVRYLKSQRDGDFDGRLVNDFALAFGYYPTGSLVELSTGQVGFVIQQNRFAQLQPRVYVVMDAKGKRPQEFVTVNLADQSLNVMIKKCLKAGSYGIDF